MCLVRPLFRRAAQRHSPHKEANNEDAYHFYRGCGIDRRHLDCQRADDAVERFDRQSSAAGAATQTIGSSPFCIKTSASGSLNCKYASLAACEKDAKPQNLNCSPNPNRGTTGSSTNMK